jgi:anti-anti-sigma factor
VIQVKIDTREKFHAITIREPEIAANMTEELDRYLLPLLDKDVRNVVLILQDTQNMDIAAAEHLVKTQQYFYEHNSSFVICGLQPALERNLDEQGLLEMMNTTITESEASDIVQMEEIERELLDGEDT